MSRLSDEQMILGSTPRLPNFGGCSSVGLERGSDKAEVVSSSLTIPI